MRGASVGPQIKKNPLLDLGILTPKISSLTGRQSLAKKAIYELSLGARSHSLTVTIPGWPPKINRTSGVELLSLGMGTSCVLVAGGRAATTSRSSAIIIV